MPIYLIDTEDFKAFFLEFYPERLKVFFNVNESKQERNGINFNNTY